MEIIITVIYEYSFTYKPKACSAINVRRRVFSLTDWCPKGHLNRSSHLYLHEVATETYYGEIF